MNNVGVAKRLAEDALKQAHETTNANYATDKRQEALVWAVLAAATALENINFSTRRIAERWKDSWP